jgi:RNA polymerase sigma-70 factor, ECF subfamily
VEISGSLTGIFRAHARVGVALPDGPDALERVLSERFEKAKARWPGVALPALYLACACASRVPGADGALEREYLARLPAILRDQFRGAPEATIDDVVAEVREKLLMGTPSGGPHLLTYTGEGALMSWVMVIAKRALIKLLPQPGAQPAFPLDELIEELPANPDPERDAIKRDLHRKFREATQEAVRTLVTQQEDRSLLSLYYKRGVSTVALAEYFNVSQPTMWRRLERLRKELRAESERLMREKYGIGGEALKALISGLESRFDVTLSSIFGSDAG